jgi:hypothetical protein
MSNQGKEVLSNQTVFVESLSEIFNEVAKFGNIDKLAEQNEINVGETTERAIWYRGQSNSNYHLIPKAFRLLAKKATDQSGNFYAVLCKDEKKYINDFSVRNQHLVSNYPDNPLSWMIMMQHYGTPTRLLDWSESIMAALFFSLERYFSITPTDEDKLPCIWCLKPCELNASYITHLSKQVINTSMTFQNNPIDYFINLSNLADDYCKDAPNLTRPGKFPKTVFDSLRQFLLPCKKSDADKYSQRNKYPLAIVPSLSNERIKAQSGVFTIFPIPCPNEVINSVVELSLDMKSDADLFLRKIVLLKPFRISEELKRVGMRRMSFYPELASSEFDIDQDMKKLYL